MDKTQAKEFFERNPNALREMSELNENGVLDKLDSYFLLGKAANEADARVNCVAAFHAIAGQ